MTIGSVTPPSTTSHEDAIVSRYSPRMTYQEALNKLPGTTQATLFFGGRDDLTIYVCHNPSGYNKEEIQDINKNPENLRNRIIANVCPSVVTIIVRGFAINSKELRNFFVSGIVQGMMANFTDVAFKYTYLNNTIANDFAFEAIEDSRPLLQKTWMITLRGWENMNKVMGGPVPNYVAGLEQFAANRSARLLINEEYRTISLRLIHLVLSDADVGAYSQLCDLVATRQQQFVQTGETP